MEDKEEYTDIINWISRGHNKEVIEWVEQRDCHHMSLDNNFNNFIHHSAKADNIELLKYFLNWDRKTTSDFGSDINSLMNEQNELEQTPLDLCISNEPKLLLKEFGAKTGKEVQEEWDRMEDEFYSDMDRVRKVRVGHSTSKQMFEAIENNDLTEFIRLAELDSEEGGLLLFRFISKNEKGQSFRELATELNRTEILDYLNRSAG